jgi:hypothetical protein
MIVMRLTKSSALVAEEPVRSGCEAQFVLFATELVRCLKKSGLLSNGGRENVNNKDSDVSGKNKSLGAGAT